MQLKDGSHLQGKGSLDSAGVHSREAVSNKLQVVTLQILEDLMTIDEATYNQRRGDLLNATQAKP